MATSPAWKRRGRSWVGGRSGHLSGQIQPSHLYVCFSRLSLIPALRNLRPFQMSPRALQGTDSALPKMSHEISEVIKIGAKGKTVSPPWINVLLTILPCVTLLCNRQDTTLYNVPLSPISLTSNRLPLSVSSDVTIRCPISLLQDY